MFWAAVAVIVNATDVWDTVSPQVVFRNKSQVGLINKGVETLQI